MNAGRRTLLLATLGAALYGTVALFLVFNGATNVDEGFYGLISRAVLGGLLPYRDFAYTQMPLFPYIQGALMKVIGFGFIEQRLASGLWAFLTVAIGTTWLWRRKSPALACAFAALMTTGLQWMYFAHLGKTHAFVGLVVLAAALVVLSQPRFGPRMFWLSLLGVLAVGCRLPTGPFFFIVWTGLVAREFSGRNLARALAYPVLFSLVLIAPFIAAAPHAFWFWALDFHRVSNVLKYWHLSYGDMFVFAPAVNVMLLLLAAGLMTKRLRLAAPLDILLLGLVATFTLNVIPRGTYPEYAMPEVPGLVLTLVLAFGSLPRIAAAPWAWGILCLVNLTGPPVIDTAIYGETRKAAAFVRQFQQPGFPFIGSASIVALEAGSPVDPRMLMGSFCCTEAYDEAGATRLHMMTPEGIAKFMEDPRCDVFILFHSLNVNFTWSMPGFNAISQGAISRYKAVLARDFVLEYGDSNYVVFIRRSLYKAKAP
jgi:hypothetical protein